MAQETLKLVITADTQEALTNLQNFIKSSAGLKEEMQNFGKVGNQATNALSNLSRVAQDAPYGFIGIANNLNPLLESFQRLQKEAGGTKSALQAMASGLMGPAGIGLALGAVSSLIVAFGPKIANFIKGVDAASEADKKFAESLDKAKASASETGVKLQAYIGIAENASLSDEKRAKALNYVVSELGKINKSYADTIKTTDQARAAVDLYTQALVAQAITSRYIDEIADKTIKLAEANKKILETGRAYYKTLEATGNLQYQLVGTTVAQAAATVGLKDANLEARKEANNLKNGIQNLNNELSKTITLALDNPFTKLDTGAKNLEKTTKKIANNVQQIGGVSQFRPAGNQQGIPTNPAQPIAPLGEAGIGFQGAPSQAIIDAQAAEEAIGQIDLLNAAMGLTAELTDAISYGFNNVFEAMVNGDDIGQALLETFKQITVQLIEMVAKALIFRAILKTLTAGLGIPTDFINAAAFGQGGGLMGEFLLKGSDLVLATQRANNNLKYRRGS